MCLKLVFQKRYFHRSLHIIFTIMDIRDTFDLLPRSSQQNYAISCKRFMDWRNKNGKNSFSEEVTLMYFEELSKTLKSSSLWSHYSMLKSTLMAKFKIDLSKYLKLRAFLKRRAEGYIATKAKALTADEVDLFMKEAPDYKYLLTKVATAIGITGSCRRTELRNLKIDNLEDLNSALLIRVPDPKTKVPRVFTLTGYFYDIYKKYAALRPSDTEGRWFFLNYQYGKCTRQIVGVNKFGSMPKQIAMFLKLPNPELYTGHSFRKSSTNRIVYLGSELRPLRPCLNSEPEQHEVENTVGTSTKDFSTSNLNNENNENSSKTPGVEDDQYTIFANFVASEMRNIKSDYLRRKMKRKIHQVILEITEEDEETYDQIKVEEISIEENSL